MAFARRFRLFLRLLNRGCRGRRECGILVSLQKLVSTDKILFGTDFPGGTSEGVAQGLRELKMFSESDRRAIERDNAARLISRLELV